MYLKKHVHKQGYGGEFSNVVKQSFAKSNQVDLVPKSSKKESQTIQKIEYKSTDSNRSLLSKSLVTAGLH